MIERRPHWDDGQSSGAAKAVLESVGIDPLSVLEGL